MDVLQMLPQDPMEDHEELMKRLEMCYGYALVKQVYQSQMKSRRQKADESIQEVE